MPLGVDIGASADTLATTERKKGEVGPLPDAGRLEIRWCRLDGRDVVVKAGSEELRDRLRREGEVLRRIGGMPVVDFEEVAEGADHTELVTTKYGSLTLEESGLLDPRECGAALVSLCDVVEALHAHGWAHGALEPSHIAVDPGTGVRLCSLAEACESDSNDGRTALVSDRDALASIVAEVLARPPGFESRRVRRQWSRSARRALPRLVAARGLRSPAQIRDILEDVGLPGTGEEREQSPDRNSAGDGSDRHPRRAAVVAVAGVLAMLSGATAWILDDGPDEVDAASLCMDVEGDDTCDDVEVNGQTIVVNGRRYLVGRPGDVARLGDWNCDGRATVALLRPSTGQLYGFQGWAEIEGQEVGAEYLGTFDGASSISEQSRCGPVVLETEDGRLLDSSSASDTAGDD